MYSNNRLRLTIPVVAVALLIAVPCVASWVHDGERHVAFRATGPGGLGIEGKSPEVLLREQDGVLVVTIGLAKLKTGIELRDKHMREKYLETSKYPVAEFTLAKSKARSPFEGAVDGELKLHGVTKAVRVHYKATGSGKHATVSGSARLHMKDFNIEVPSYLGVTVKPEVTITFKLDVVDK